MALIKSFLLKGTFKYPVICEVVHTLHRSYYTTEVLATIPLFQLFKQTKKEN